MAAATVPARGQAAQVSYLVTVLAEGGAPVTNLTAADFTVREGGEPRKVISAELSKFPLAVSILVDGTQPPIGMSSAVRHLREALSGFVSAIRSSSTAARLSLTEVAGGSTVLARFDAKPEDLDAAIAKLFPAHPADAVLLESFGAAAKALSAMQTPRRAIVAVDFNSSESLTEDTMKRTTAALQASGATVWSVSLRSPRSSTSRREGGLNLITKASGGQRVVASESSGLQALLTQVADSLASQYIVTFERAGAGGPKDITMTLASGATVRVSLMRR